MSIQRRGHRYRDAETGKTVDAWFPSSNRRLTRHCLAERAGFILGNFIDVSIGDLTQPPLSTEEVWLRLHLISQRLVKPNESNLDGIFDLLTNVAWTSAGLVLPGRVDDLRNAVAADYHHLIVRPSINFPGRPNTSC
jgi:2,3,4,5-tetrahydropyridine-2,6-dicarboxylate N-succinyltransferase